MIAAQQVHLAIHELPPLVELQPVGDEEQMLGVEVDLRALIPVPAVLDGQLVQAELVLQGTELVVAWVDDVQPDAVPAVARGRDRGGVEGGLVLDGSVATTRKVITAARDYRSTPPRAANMTG